MKRRCRNCLHCKIIRPETPTRSRKRLFVRCSLGRWGTHDRDDAEVTRKLIHVRDSRPDLIGSHCDDYDEMGPCFNFGQTPGIPECKWCTGEEKGEGSEGLKSAEMCATIGL